MLSQKLLHGFCSRWLLLQGLLRQKLLPPIREAVAVTRELLLLQVLLLPSFLLD